RARSHSGSPPRCARQRRVDPSAPVKQPVPPTVAHPLAIVLTAVEGAAAHRLLLRPLRRGVATVLATIPSATLLGARGRPVTVEVHVAQGLPGFTVVGLPDEACRESRDRVRAALLSSGMSWPQKRITVNLAPSGVRKGGAGLD